jgi:hypothetical protein
MSDVLKLHRRQFTVAEIAERLGLTASEVTRQIVAERKRREAWVPTPEEIAEAATAIRRAKGITDDLS